MLKHFSKPTMGKIMISILFLYPVAHTTCVSFPLTCKTAYLPISISWVSTMPVSGLTVNPVGVTGLTGIILLLLGAVFAYLISCSLCFMYNKKMSSKIDKQTFSTITIFVIALTFLYSIAYCGSVDNDLHDSYLKAPDAEKSKILKNLTSRGDAGLPSLKKMLKISLEKSHLVKNFSYEHPPWPWFYTYERGINKNDGFPICAVAAIALGELGDPTAIPFLEEAAKNNPDLKDVFNIAISMLRKCAKKTKCAAVSRGCSAVQV